MAAILTADLCPAVQILSTSLYENSTSDTTAKVAKNIPAAVTWRTQANQNAAILDQTARYGAGLIGIPDGPTKITLSVGTGLSLSVSAGHAMVGGPVEIATATTLTVPNNTSRVWIWLRQLGGALTYTTTTTPPAGECCLLGSCVTSGGAVTSVDTSGVMYLRGGIGWRQSADVFAPTDSPSVTIQFMASTAGGSYFWDGYTYSRLAGSYGSVTTVTASASDEDDRLDTLERKFRSLLFVLSDMLGEDVLITDELANDFDMASSEV